MSQKIRSVALGPKATDQLYTEGPHSEGVLTLKKDKRWQRQGLLGTIPVRDIWYWSTTLVYIYSFFAPAGISYLKVVFDK